MGKRSSTVYSPAVLIEADPEEMHPISKRQKIAHEDAALALLSFRNKSIVNLGPEVVKSASTKSHTKKKKRELALVDAITSVLLQHVPKDSPLTPAKPVVVKSIPLVKPNAALSAPQPSAMVMKPLTMPVLPTKVQHRRLPPLPAGRPLAMAPKLAGHLTKQTKPINLTLS